MFSKIWETYVSRYLGVLDISTRVRLAAFAVSGQLVDSKDTFDGDIKWAQLRDSSLCLLTVRHKNECDIQVSYPLLHSIRSSPKMPPEERHFADSLNDLHQYVDKTTFSTQAWYSWEIFGACFYAVRINALLLLVFETVTLKELLPGAVMDEKTQAISVKLVPMRVFWTADTFDASTTTDISAKSSVIVKIDWTSPGRFVVNGENGKEIEYWQDSAKQCRESCQFLKDRGARLIRGIMNSVGKSNLAEFDVPPDCYIMSRADTREFHGTLSYHPACSPIIPINWAGVTALRTVLEGKPSEVKEVIKLIFEKKRSGGYRDNEERSGDIQSKGCKVQVDAFAQFSS
ncbi:Crinkler (CRN) family protein [Phytophthora palmivora]|uniref:Crinkler (CRN) family protein n=1 Tax=Phytophthora palmivora TaxID=4796 RepID=A0A2P4XNK6_9STRA|nr:Crinkler (CRN) family protein [Phytophthora palmivora]